MRDETKRKLNALQRSDRSALLILAIVGLLVGWLVYAQPILRQRTMMATVTVSSMGIDVSTGQRDLRIQARLDDGRLVRVDGGLQSLPPHHGVRIVVEERLTAIWGRTYIWMGEAKQ